MNATSRRYAEIPNRAEVEWATWRNWDEVACENRGPRIGSEGVPLCARVKGHDGPHMPHESWVSQIAYWNDL